MLQSTTRYDWHGTPDSGMLVRVDDVALEPGPTLVINQANPADNGIYPRPQPADVHPFHEEELENQRVPQAGARPSIVSYRGPWDAAATYNRGDLVVLNDNTAWVACEQNFGIEPNSWRDMHTWDFISQEGPARTGQWRLDRVMEQIEAQQRAGEPSLFEQPKCPWCQIRGCDNPRHPENLKAIHQIAEQGGF